MNWLIVIAFSLSVINLTAVVILTKIFITEKDFLLCYIKGEERHLSNLWDRFNSHIEEEESSVHKSN